MVLDPDEAERVVRVLAGTGKFSEAAELVDQLGSYGVAAGPDETMSLGAAVLEALADQLAAADPPSASAAYARAAGLQRTFAAAASSGGEGLARTLEATRIDSKRTDPTPPSHHGTV